MIASRRVIPLKFKKQKMFTKKTLRISIFVLLIAITSPAWSSNAPLAQAQTNSAATTENIRTREITQRLQEIKEMDKSTLTRAEKRGLVKEVKGMKKEMKAMSGGVYLSLGAIIIVILLLILIL